MEYHCFVAGPYLLLIISWISHILGYALEKNLNLRC